jgi:hypothetical protein
LEIRLKFVEVVLIFKLNFFPEDMMQRIPKLNGALNAVLLLLLINTPSFAFDLIEPSRTLSSPAKSAGELSVFSEPPELNVKIDGTQIGKTPLVGQKLEPGIHAIRVKDSEIEIYVEPGKSIRLSWFKDTFIEIPAETKEGNQRQSAAQEKVSHIKISTQPVEKKEKADPFYWPLNPRGPIYYPY